MQLQRERLLLLSQSGVINGSVYDAVCGLLDYLKARNIYGEEDRLNMMSIHIAMALMRAQNGESIPSADGGLVDEIHAHPSYPEALALWEGLADILGDLPEGEKYYVLANFCNIIEG